MDIACMYIYVCVYVYIYMYVCVYIHAFTHYEKKQTPLQVIFMITHVYDPSLFHSYILLIKAKWSAESLSAIAKLHN